MKRFLPALPVIFLFSCANSDTKEETPKEVKQYTIEQFYKSTQVGGGAISSDDTKLLVSSNESGIYNAYEIDIASDQKKALTNSTKESVFANDYVPGSANFIYNADKGGNENDHLFLQKTDGTVKDLTPGEKEKAGFWGWSRDNKFLYYTSNKRDPRFFDLYKMDTSTWTPVIVYKNESGFDVGAISDNEQYLALVQPVTTSSSNLFLLDQQTRQMKKINADSIESNNGPLQFSMDNKTLFYTTDEGSEYQHVMKYNIPSGNKEKFYATNWDVMYMYTSLNEKYRVVGVNEDGRNKLYIFDHKTGAAIDFPKIENGDVQAVNISRSENKMRLTIGDGKSPTNIYVYDFGTKELKKLTKTLNPEINGDELVSAEVVRYKSFDGLEIPAIYYKPHQAGKKNKVPALVWVHGGPGGQSRVGYFSLIQYLVNHGYAILAVNNRGSSGYGKTFHKMDNRNHGDKDLNDCVWGKKWLANQDYIDSTKIGIIGGSYGGYMTLAALAFKPDEFNVGVDIFGVANWLRTLKEIPPYWESFKKALYEEIGDPNTTDTIRLKQYSPLLHASNIKKPLMVLQGANDPRVLQVESDEVVAAVKKNNVPVEYTIFPDEGHGFVKKENEIKGYGQILQFLDKHLKGQPGNPKKD
ncbi:S9 family peptidase [Terrimonas alba]|uniref:S9 family peptidase n=1 Tax=Terrimonas alba TaxID=3349636 RepID=UPI0035F30A41